MRAVSLIPRDALDNRFDKLVQWQSFRHRLNLHGSWLLARNDTSELGRVVATQMVGGFLSFDRRTAGTTVKQS